jgi:hypothetical protein
VQDIRIHRSSDPVRYDEEIEEWGKLFYRPEDMHYKKVLSKGLYPPLREVVYKTKKERTASPEMKRNSHTEN